MSLDLLMSQEFAVRRGADGEARTTSSTICGRIAPRGGSENENGMHIADATHIVRVPVDSDVTEADWLLSGGITYNVLLVSDAAGAGHHKMLDVKEIR